MGNPIHEYFSTLGLRPGSSAEDIRRAYRKLIQEWHPDRFAVGSLMQTTAEDLTKEVNEAYEQLYKKGLYKKYLKAEEKRHEPAAATRTTQAAGKAGASVADKPKPRQKAARPPPAPRPGRPASSAEPRRAEPPPAPKAARAPFRLRRRWILGAVAAAVVVGACILWPRTGEPAAASASRPDAAALAEARPAADAPSAVAPVAIRAAEATRGAPGRGEHGSALSDYASTARAEAGREARPASFSTDASPAQASAGSAGGVFVGEANDAPADAWSADVACEPTAYRPSWSARSAAAISVASRLTELNEGLTITDAELDYFDIGDSEARVLAVQGKPDESSEGIFRYGSSVVFFAKGKVSGWSNGVPRLRIRVLPNFEADELANFTIGSTRAEVVDAQGQPWFFTADSYYFGNSVVRFENDHVVSWIQVDRRLRTQILPDLPFLDIGAPAGRP